ncbi:MAG: efflux RND transporter periplasmic adaptor subunit [Maioricimonas sp. JB049]
MRVFNRTAIWKWSRIVLSVAVIAVVALTFPRWWPQLNHWVEGAVAARRTTPVGGHGHGDHGADDDHDHAHDEHAGHSAEESLDLSAQARRNIGLTSEFVRPVTLQTFRRTMTVPAIVTERPGRTRIRVATPLTGLITRIHAVQGEAVQPGALLFDIRLTHEDLVQTQTEFLQALGELDVELREIARLREVSQSGAVPGRLILERQYAREKLEALLTAQREALRLHGLSDRQVEEVEESRRLLRELHIAVPEPEEPESGELQLSARRMQPIAFIEDAAAGTDVSVPAPPLVLQELMVHMGQAVTAGEDLCVVADYGELFIEGQAFERDAAAIAHAQQQGWTVSAEFESLNGGETVAGLEIAFLSNEVDVDSRTLAFFVNLPNEIIRDRVNRRDQRFISWRYRPGQRLQLHIPVEEWENEIVVPVEAVAHEGAEYYVFQENGGHFDRVAVHVKYRDRKSVVIANDGSLFPGDVIAMRGAHQMQMALKNRAGGAVDPHAGHNH